MESARKGVAMIVHIVAPDQATKSGPKIGLCGGKVESLYVRHRNGSRNAPGTLCAPCVAASAKLAEGNPSEENDDRSRT